MDCSGKYFFLDGTIYESDGTVSDSHAEISFYEVIRTSNGVPWFYDDHIMRLTDGISTRYDVPDDLKENIKSGINELVSRESYSERNIRITVSFTGHEHSIHICFIESGYPDPEMFNKGVKLITYRAERFDPGVKTLNARLRLSVDEELKSRNAYEALLVNHEGIITEGSRSNVFFIDKDENIVTTPDDLVLPGVTRKHVIEICRENGRSVRFVKIKVSDISSFQSAFISGTSPTILPARNINDVSYNASSPLITEIRECYMRLARQSQSAYNSKI